MTEVQAQKPRQSKHWKQIALAAQADCAILQAEVDRLRATGADSTDVAKIRAESFAAGVASATAHLIK